jgi:hypothetical protein
LLALAAVLSVQTLYHNAVFLVGIGLGGWTICWLRRDKSAALKILASMLAAAVSLLPYLAAVSRWQTGTTIRPGFSFRAALGNLGTMLAFPLPLYTWIWALLGLSVLGLGLLAWIERRASVSEPAGAETGPPSAVLRWTGAPAARELTSAEWQVFAGVVLLTSLVGYFVFLYFAALITSPWYFLPLMAVTAACFDLAISLEPELAFNETILEVEVARFHLVIPLWALPRWPRTVVWGMGIGTVVLAGPFAVRDLNCRFTNMDAAVQRLASELSPQDYVLVTPWYLGISFNYYYHGPAVWDTMPPMADHSIHRFDLVPVTAAGMERARQPVLERMTHTLQAGHHVWVVGWMSIPAPHHTAATVESGMLAEHSQTFVTLDLKLKGRTSDYEEVSLLQASGWRAGQSSLFP